MIRRFPTEFDYKTKGFMSRYFGLVYLIIKLKFVHLRIPRMKVDFKRGQNGACFSRFLSVKEVSENLLYKLRVLQNL